MPVNALSDAERAHVLEVVSASEHVSVTPHQLVPKLADEQTYLRESTIYRLLRAAGQQHHRGRSKAPQ